MAQTAANERLLSRNDFADMIGVTPRHLSLLRTEGLPSTRVGNGHQYPVPAAFHWYLRYKQEPEKKGTIDLRTATAKAELAEYALAKMREEMVSADYMAAQLAALGSKIRAKLQTLPDKYATELTGLPTADIRETLTDAVGEVLQMLQNIPDELDAEEDVEPDPDDSDQTTN